MLEVRSAEQSKNEGLGADGERQTRDRVYPIARTPYVVARLGQNHNSAVEWAAQRLPGGQQSKKEEVEV